MRSTADLQDYLDAIDLCYFNGALEDIGVDVKWARARHKDPERLGGYWPDTKVIEVARVLGDESVPRFFVMYIIFHEALHAIYGKDHTKAFKLAEKQFLYTYEVADWETSTCDAPWPDPPRGLR